MCPATGAVRSWGARSGLRERAFWPAFRRILRDRGLGGIQLMISDHHGGLMNAMDTTMAGVL